MSATDMKKIGFTALVALVAVGIAFRVPATRRLIQG